MGISKKIRKKRSIAPLSAIDKLIYAVAFLVLMVIIAVGIVTYAVTIPTNIAYSDTDAIAVSSTKAWISSMSPAMTGLMILIPLGIGIDKKQPLFGNKNYNSADKYFVIHKTPLFTKKFFKELTRKTIKHIKIFCIVFAVILFTSSLIAGLTIYPRKALEYDGKLVTYDSFNNISHEQKVDNAKSFTVGTEWVSSRRGLGFYRITVKFEFADGSYSFNLPDFKEIYFEDSLEYLLEVKEKFGDGRFFTENEDDLERVFEHNDYTPSERQLIYELFDTND